MKLSRAFQIQPGEVVALVGGGGKSSAMFRLGRELALAGERVLLTTTTRIAADQTEEAPSHVICSRAKGALTEILPQLNRAIDKYGQVLLTGPIDQAIGRASGVPAELIDKLARSGTFDVIINEADGANRLPFKAPASYEPVIPSSTSLGVAVVGLDVLGNPLDEGHVHRPQLVSRLGQIVSGEEITAEVIARVLTHPAGGLKNIPATARIIPFLNKLEQVNMAAAQRLAQLILRHKRVQSVAIGSARGENRITWVENRVAAIVLAAGEASRFGSPKQLALWQGKPLLAHVVDTALASQAERTIVVLGAYARACQEVLGDRPVEIVFNENWAAGQSTSMKAGLAALPDQVSAAIFPLADQPLVTAAVIDAVISGYQQTLAPIIWPEFKGRRGNPVLFDHSLFEEMRRVGGDTGARPILQTYRAQADTVAVSEPGILHDIDTPDDLPGSQTVPLGQHRE